MPPLDYDRVYRLKRAHPRLHGHPQRRHRQRRRGTCASRSCRRRHDGPRRLSGAVAAYRRRSAGLRRGRLLRLSESRPRRRSCPISSANWRRARGCTASPGICTACSAPCPARAPSAAILPAPPPRLMRARNTSPPRSHWSRISRPGQGRRIGAHRRLDFHSERTASTHAIRRSVERDCLARARRRHRRRRHRDSRRTVRHRRRRGHRAGALRSVSRARRARGGAHAALRRHLDRHHPADDGALLSDAPRRRAWSSRA